MMSDVQNLEKRLIQLGENDPYEIVHKVRKLRWLTNVCNNLFNLFSFWFKAKTRLTPGALSHTQDAKSA